MNGHESLLRAATVRTFLAVSNAEYLAAWPQLDPLIWTAALAVSDRALNPAVQAVRSCWCDGRPVQSPGPGGSAVGAEATTKVPAVTVRTPTAYTTIPARLFVLNLVFSVPS